MKLIIDISEKVYDEYMNLAKGRIPTYKACDIAYVLKNGTPLPKGHGRLIDADVLADGFEDNYEFCEVVNATPTIIEADKEVKND